ncbi:MAG: 30S ribosomal protein S20 [Bacilli bacterium]|nr:30S ribosomal protein S20 [Bacilli bacterium]
MANIKSSKKAIKQIAKTTQNNHELKARVKNSIRNAEKAIAAKNKEEAVTLVKEVQVNIDKAQAKGLVKKNTAAREKSRLNKKVKELN